MGNKEKFQYKKLVAVLVFSFFIAPLAPFSSDLSLSFAHAATGPTYTTTLDPSLIKESSSSNSPLEMNNFTKYGTKVLGCNNSAGVFKRALSSLNSENANLATNSVGSISGSSNETSGGDNLIGLGNNAANIELNKTGNKDAALNAASGANAKALGMAAQAVTDQGVISSLKQLNENEKKALEVAADKKVWEQCLNGIAVKVAQKQIVSMTQSIVNWVNTGFQGDSLFVKDEKAFLKKLGDDTLQSYVGPLTDPRNASIYPYGKDTAKILINNAKATTQSKLQSTFARSLPSGVTPDDFSDDFGKGGWDAWLSLTQNPANNPLGFNMIASQDLIEKVASETQGVLKELDRGNGFLSATKCVERKPVDQTTGPGTTTRQTISPVVGEVGFLTDNVEMSETGFDITLHYDAPGVGELKAILQTSSGTLVGSAKTVGTFTTAPYSDTIRLSYDNLTPNTKYKLYLTFKSSTSTKKEDNGNAALFNISLSPQVAKDPLATSDCIRTEVTTPGSIVADQVSTVLTSPIRQLELAKTVNDSLDQVFNALINQLTSKGLAELDSYTMSQTYTNSVEGDVPEINMITKSYYDTYSNLIKVNQGYGGWNRTSVDFDITRDLGDIYTQKLIETADASGTITQVPQTRGGKPLLTVAKKGIISIQSDYIDAATESVKALDPILPAIGKLDYCIPGPNPSWEIRTKNHIYSLQNWLANMDYNGVQKVAVPRWLQTDKNLSLATGLVSGAGLLLSAPTGGISLAVSAAFGFISSMIQNNHERQNSADASEVQRQNYLSEYYFSTNQAHLINSFTDRFGPYQEAIAQRYSPLFAGSTGGAEGKCNDGINNDADNLIDGDDPGCHSDGNPTNAASWDKNKTTETDLPPAQCNDGIDNNPVPNGLKDADDPGCILNGVYDKYDRDETKVAPPACMDGVENDIGGTFPNNTPPDGFIDAADPGCHTDGDPHNSTTYDKYLDLRESNGFTIIRNNLPVIVGTCSDWKDTNNNGIKDAGDAGDNDGDGYIDEKDTGCHTDLDPNNQNSYAPFKTSEYHTNIPLLPMAAEGLNITKDIDNYDANIAQARQDYQTQVTQAKNNITQLKSIKKQVDAIMKVAQKRRTDLIAQMKKDAAPTLVDFCAGVDTTTPIVVEEQIYVDPGDGGGSGNVQ